MTLKVKNYPKSCTKSQKISRLERSDFSSIAIRNNKDLRNDPDYILQKLDHLYPMSRRNFISILNENLKMNSSQSQRRSIGRKIEYYYNPDSLSRPLRIKVPVQTDLNYGEGDGNIQIRNIILKKRNYSQSLRPQKVDRGI
mmetsp:Transcript_19993/g.17666  ORF Transcript_19993/g.17666 Transcript_19993/m.17666 type:complete len:141 (+) Transcript_19993:350-772(+)